MGNKCPVKTDEECDRQCDDGKEMHANPQCQLQGCPECDQTTAMNIHNETCEYLLHPEENSKDYACSTYEIQKENKKYSGTKCKSLDNYWTFKDTTLKSALDAEVRFLEDIRTKQQDRRAILDGESIKAEGDLRSAETRISKKATTWNPSAYCDRREVTTPLHPIINDLQKNNTVIFVRVQSKQAAEAAAMMYQNTILNR